MKELRVLISDKEAGTLSQDRTGRCHFSDDLSWQRSAASVPLSLSMPLTATDHRPAAVESFMWGLLPDNQETLARWGRTLDVNPRNPFALLSEVGEDLPGAVQTVKSEKLSELRGRENVTWLSADKLAKRFADLMRDPGSTKFTETGGLFSLAGAQRKKALYLVNGRWGEPKGRTPTTHILKPAISGFRGQVENEMFCMRLAVSLGMPAPPIWTERFGDVPVVVIQRYDRVRRDGNRVIKLDRSGGRVDRIHQEDCCQALKVRPDQKYQRDGGPGIKEIMHLLAASRNPAEDRDTFMRTLAYNFVIGGTDGHAKNDSVLISTGGRFRLAPMYDIASWLPYTKTGGRDKLAMSVDGHSRLDEIMPRHWEAAAKSSGFNPAHATALVWDVIARLPEAAGELLGKCSAEGSATDEMTLLIKLISERARNLAEVYGSESITTGRRPLSS